MTMLINSIAAAARFAVSKDKRTAPVIARFKTAANGLTMVGKYPDPAKNDWVSMPESDWRDYCNNVQRVYNAALNCNECTDPAALPQYENFLFAEVKELFARVDPSITLGENPTTRRFVNDIRADQKAIALYKSAEYREESVRIGRFAAMLEKRLYVVAKGTTFAPDWERDWNRTEYALNKRIKAATAAKAKAEEAVTEATTTRDTAAAAHAAAIESGKAASTIAKRENELRAAESELANKVAAVRDLNTKLTDLAARLTAAETAYNTAKAAAEAAATPAPAAA